MKKTILLALAILYAAAITAQNQATLADAQISFVFVSKKVNGTLSGFRSSSTIDLQTITNSKFKGTVDATTLDTDNFLRNWSLKGDKYFDVDNFPELRFEGTMITETPNGFTVNGDLTLKGITKPFAIDFQWAGKKLVGKGKLNTTDYGIEIIKKKREDNEVTIQFSFAVK